MEVEEQDRGCRKGAAALFHDNRIREVSTNQAYLHWQGIHDILVYTETETFFQAGGFCGTSAFYGATDLNAASAAGAKRTVNREEQMKKAGEFCRAIWIAVYLLLTLTLAVLIIACVTEPQHNLLAGQMALGTVLGGAFLIAALFLWERYLPQKIAGNPWLYYGLLILYGISLYGVSCFCRNSPDSFADYQQVWAGAAELAAGEGLSQEWYFKIYANNIKPMLLLSVLFRASAEGLALFSVSGSGIRLDQLLGRNLRDYTEGQGDQGTDDRLDCSGDEGRWQLGSECRVWQLCESVADQGGKSRIYQGIYLGEPARICESVSFAAET
ncbi:MAG: hypothetical protein NC432_05130 [Roseburia sp.]|nr:hypothetical protein [Roseburia sp.]MCM1097890.1 hypothetical protein [Ruminococcus flavefaciens]